MKKHGHGMVGKQTPTYTSWHLMKQRCFNPNHHKYHRYGARGITVCQRWIQFQNFLEDVGERPVGCTIDRIDNNGNYEPNNCKWASSKQQQRNMSTNIKYSYGSEELTAKELSERCGIHHSTLTYRLKKGWDVNKATTKWPKYDKVLLRI